jgi:drug/metabolite transporter (DMT)-like permease
VTTILLGLASALLIGLADLFGSLGGRRGRVLAVTFWVFIIGIVSIVPAAVLVPGSPTARDMALGGVAGVAGGIGLLTLYAGYARTTIGIVGPIAAVLGAALPVTVGMVKDRPGAAAVLGIVIGLASIALIGLSPSIDEGDAHPRAAIGFGIAAGVAFGFMATIIGFTDTGAGMWPIVPMRAASAATLVVLAMAGHRPLLPVRESWRYIPAAAALSAVGIGLFAMAAQRDLIVGGLLLQMAYGITAVLAIMFLGERSTRTQQFGFVGAIASIVLLMTG